MPLPLIRKPFVRPLIRICPESRIRALRLPGPGARHRAPPRCEVEVGFVDRNNLHDGREVVELLADLERVAAG